jgi:hypothetical protein
MDLLAASIIGRCISGPLFRSLGSLTRSTRGVGRRNYPNARDRRGPSIYPLLVECGTIHYGIEKGRMVYIDMKGREEKTAFFEAEPKVIVDRRISDERLAVGYTEERLALNKDLNIITPRSFEIDPMYLIGILGSRLASFLYLNHILIAYKGEKKRMTLEHLRKLPVPIKRPIERGLIIGLVIQLLNQKANDPCASTKDLERNIDQLVYRLYGLTEDEVKQVEHGMRLEKPEVIAPAGPSVPEELIKGVGTIKLKDPS